MNQRFRPLTSCRVLISRRLFEKLVSSAAERLGEIRSVSTLQVSKSADQYLKPFPYEENVDSESLGQGKRYATDEARKDPYNYESAASSETGQKRLASEPGYNSDEIHPSGGVIDDNAEHGGGSIDQWGNNLIFDVLGPRSVLYAV